MMTPNAQPHRQSPTGTTVPPNLQWFKDARYGLFIQYGLYALLERGEWVLNRERIPIDEYRALADRFTADRLDMDELLGRARNEWGMRYAVMTCKHHDGFCLYDSALTDFTSVKTRCGRDLVREFVEACRKHGMRIALYHSLNDWTSTPNAVDALNRPEECYQPFIDYVHGQFREILSHYGPIDVLWYDGWWPYDGKGWQGEKLNAMARELQPGILVNGRCGIEGDFETPEGHMGSVPEGRPWEAYMNLNESGGYHRGDHNWKRPMDVVELLRQGATRQGNLMLNLAPKGDGTIPEAWEQCAEKVGAWLKQNGEAIYDANERFELSLRGPEGRSDWNHHGRFSASERAFYWHINRWPGNPLVLAGVQCQVVDVSDLATGKHYAFRQEETRLIVEGVPDSVPPDLPTVIRFETSDPPRLYNCGGYTVPEVDHCRYDPLPSDLLVH